MKKLLITFTLPFILSGCIGCWIGGHTNRFGDEFPDIRKVPERAEATASRGTHGGNEQVERAADFKELESDREKIKARVEALSEDRLPELPEKEPKKKSKRGGKDAPSKSVEPDTAAPSAKLEPLDEAMSSDQKPETFETLF